jgi:hypothetical protein
MCGYLHCQANLRAKKMEEKRLEIYAWRELMGLPQRPQNLVPAG